MAKSIVTVGQIGCGYWGKNLLRVLMESRDAEVLRVADMSSGAREFVKSRYPDLLVSGDETAVFSDDSIESVIIATPTNDHYRSASLSLSAGKHTFVEKPLAMTCEQAQELVDLARSKGLVLMAGHTFLFNSAVNRVKSLVDAGYLGDVHYLYSRRLNLGIAHLEHRVDTRQTATLIND